ncbi:hypothetical protein JTB14_021434 [Gonioctena quinquepunctata]|nr:hypothetical protein JTB14_021434 [Gonioctena quinquepunctata]
MASQRAGRFLRGLAVGCEFGTELAVSLRHRFIFGFEKGPNVDRLMEVDVNMALERMGQIAASKMAATDVQETMVEQEPTHFLQHGNNVGARGAHRPEKGAMFGAQNNPHPN